MKKGERQLAVVVRYGDEWARAMMAKRTKKGDVYTMGAVPEVGDLKHSVHPDGKSHIQIEPRGVRKGTSRSPFWRKAETMNPTHRWAGRRRIASRTFDPGFTIWDPKPPGNHVQTVLELQEADVASLPGWTVDVWALEPGRTELVQECLDLFPVILGFAYDAEAVPELLAIAWTLETSEWEELALELYGEAPPKPGAYHVTRSLDGDYAVLRADVPRNM